MPPGSSTVVIDLIEGDEGGTLIRLTHRGLPDMATDLQDAGWRRYVERLGDVSEGFPVDLDNGSVRRSRLRCAPSQQPADQRGVAVDKPRSLAASIIRSS